MKGENTEKWGPQVHFVEQFEEEGTLFQKF
jgi:hypothetical protein